jgi:hypothetical protein
MITSNVSLIQVYAVCCVAVYSVIIQPSIQKIRNKFVANTHNKRMLMQ